MGLLRNAKILMAASPIMDQLGKESGMKFSSHMIAQMLLTLINGVTVMLPFIPDAKKWIGVGVISIIQAVFAMVNHGDSAVPPDGSGGTGFEAHPSVGNPVGPNPLGPAGTFKAGTQRRFIRRWQVWPGYIEV